MLRALSLLLLALTLAGATRGDPPPGYYNAANGLSGAALKAALNGIIDGHTVIPYEELIAPLRAIWEDPANSANIFLIYSDASVAKTASTWNREHLWPRSRGNSDQAGPDDSDLHYVVPCDSDVNSQRGALYFDNSSAADGGIITPGAPEAPQTSRDANSWEPPPNQQGDIARAIFYVAVRYDGAEPNTTDMELVNTAPVGPQMANKGTLLAWHNADPPDAPERTRHERVYSAYQSNRNPFIDRPEYAASIFGGGSSAPIAQAFATDPAAVEAPLSTGAITVQLSPPAAAGGVVVNFAMSGTAASADYALSGPGVTFNAANRTGTIAIPAGASSAVLTLTPSADGTTEPLENAVLNLTAGSGYTTTGGPGTISISDTPPAPPSGVIASWNFDAPTSPNSPRYANPLPADVGAASLRFDGWWGTIDSFTGTNEACTANLGLALSLAGAVSNGRYIDLVFSAAGQGGIVVTLCVRGTATGFDVGSWSHSTDGISFTPLPGVNTASRNTVFEPKTADFSAVQALNHAPSVRLRYTLSGATSDLANNRIDNLTIRSTPLPRITVSAPDAAAAERDANPATFTFASDVPSPASGLTLAFALGGSATGGTDYSVGGAASFDPATGNGTIALPAGATSASLTITPRTDSAFTEFNETATAQLSPVAAGTSYILGGSTSAGATIADDTPYAAAWAARFPGFSGGPLANDDGDAAVNLVECAFDLDPRVPDPGPLLVASTRELPDPNSGGAIRTYATVAFTRRTDADAPRTTPQASVDATAWSENLVLVETQPGPRLSTEHVTFRSAESLPLTRIFFRVKVTGSQ